MFLYVDSMQREMQNNRKVLGNNVDQLCRSDVKSGADDDISRNTITAKIVREPDENSAIKVCPGHSIHASIDGDYGRKVRNLSLKFLCMISFDNLFLQILCMVLLGEMCVERCCFARN